MKFGFNKTEKLTHLPTIKQLFLSGKSYSAYPVKLLYIENTENTMIPFKVLISAPKRNLALAVHRNRAKRHLREAYRLNKNIIYSVELNNKKYCFALIYLAKTNLTFNQINSKTIEVLNHFKKKIQTDAGKAGNIAD